MIIVIGEKENRQNELYRSAFYFKGHIIHRRIYYVSINIMGVKASRLGGHSLVACLPAPEASYHGCLC